MSARPFLLLALLAVPLASCDVLDEIQQAEPVPLSISSIRIVGLPEAPNRTTEWDDDGTGPDVFVEIQNPAASSVARSEVLPDVDLSQPLTLTFPGAIEAPSATAPLTLVVFDADGANRQYAEKLGSSDTFTAQDLEASGGSLVLGDDRAEYGRATTYELLQ